MMITWIEKMRSDFVSEHFNLKRLIDFWGVQEHNEKYVSIKERVALLDKKITFFNQLLKIREDCADSLIFTHIDTCGDCHTSLGSIGIRGVLCERGNSLLAKYVKDSI